MEIPEGWGQVILVVKNGNSGEERGGRAYMKFSAWLGYGYFLKLHINNL